VPLSLRILLASIPEHGEIHVNAEDGQLAIDIREVAAEVPFAGTQESAEVDAL